jgi:nucleotide-binding universal stress UspA family protein
MRVTPLIRLILHPTDFSPSASIAVRVACELAREHAAPVLVLHVVQPDDDHGSREPRSTHRQVREYWRALHKLRDQQKSVWLEPIIQRGQPPEVILETAREAACDLIVMGMRSSDRDPSRLGRVAREVVERAGCAVVCIRPPAVPSRKASQNPSVLPAGRSRRFSYFGDAEAC